MTSQQLETFQLLVKPMGVDEFHHGDCIGADAQAHEAVLGFAREVWIHPPSDDRKREFCIGATHVLDPLPYLERNHEIVFHTDVLIATPKGFEEELRSGTWATMRFARKQGKTVFVVWPDGTWGAWS
jgi:hypothetical protein